MKTISLGRSHCLTELTKVAATLSSGIGAEFFLRIAIERCTSP
ncbi:hypothetical protein [Agrobacterium sp. CCNWLW155]